ncbi:hypothetical protein [Actinoallomurus iriomotensis]|uniref:Uncharacterized protein n=1 Tax=Actinoallomurus iriomotensis TaxID=478107 RepID=A0A9W6VU32_9ACTN|nr:hypothetical protein [Actinoallomurus iriomotensis]GLY80345.1 hypothetical protein Airi01_086120 [Actinoallomurus iriomotensis]
MVYFNDMMGRRIGALPSASPPSAVLVAVAVYLAVVAVLGLGFDILRIVARDGNLIFGTAGVVGFVKWARLVAADDPETVGHADVRWWVGSL